MKAISMYQPWAFWVSFSIKIIETRIHARFRKFAGKTIAIHAGKKYDKTAFSTANQFANYNHIEHQKKSLVYGAVICTAFVDHVGWLNGSHSKRALIDCKNTRRFGLFLRNIKPLKKPFYCTGRQGPFNVDIDDNFDPSELDICDGIKIETMSLNLNEG